MNPIGFLFIAIGLFAIICSVANIEWFMNNYKARGLSKLITRNGARGVYIGIGTILCVMGVLMAMGILQDKQ